MRPAEGQAHTIALGQHLLARVSVIRSRRMQSSGRMDR
jgi:hypothetical protein